MLFLSLFLSGLGIAGLRNNTKAARNTARNTASLTRNTLAVRPRQRVWGHAYSLVVDSAETNQIRLFYHKNFNVTDCVIKMEHD